MTNEMQTGIITKGVGGLYSVMPILQGTGHPECSETVQKYGPVLCRARGKFRLEGITPLPGDNVVVVLADENGEEWLADTVEDEDDREENGADFVIREILPRRNTLIRPPMANLTHLFVVLPCASPAPDPCRAMR
jgi:ribosome biogenesis GTPase